MKKKPIKWNFKCIIFTLLFGLLFCSVGNVFSDEYTKLLIRSDTFDGDINFVDSSNSSHLIIGKGDTAHSTQKQKIGSSAIYFDGAGDYLIVPDSEDWNFGNGDFTIDFWLNTNYESGEHAIITTGDSGSGATYRNAFEIYSVNGDIRAYYSNGTNHDYLIETGVCDGTWKHIAFSRNNSQIMLFVDGILVDAKAITWTLANPPTNMTIGSRGSSQLFFTGYIDELRISKGIARWTGNFTPPTSPPQNYGNPIQTNYIAQIGNTTEQIVSETNPISIAFDKEEFASPLYTLVVFAPTGLEILQTDIYEVSYSVSYESIESGNDARRNARTFVYKNGDPINEKIQASIAYGYARGDTGSSDAPITTSSSSFFVKLNAGDTIHLHVEAVGDWINGEANILADECRLKILLIE